MPVSMELSETLAGVTLEARQGHLRTNAGDRGLRDDGCCGESKAYSIPGRQTSGKQA